MGTSEENEKLQILAEDYHEFSLESYPSYAIIKGDYRFSSELEDYSEESLEERRVEKAAI